MSGSSSNSNPNKSDVNSTDLHHRESPPLRRIKSESSMDALRINLGSTPPLSPFKKSASPQVTAGPTLDKTTQHKSVSPKKTGEAAIELAAEAKSQHKSESSVTNLKINLGTPLSASPQATTGSMLDTVSQNKSVPPSSLPISIDEPPVSQEELETRTKVRADGIAITLIERLKNHPLLAAKLLSDTRDVAAISFAHIRREAGNVVALYAEEVKKTDESAVTQQTAIHYENALPLCTLIAGQKAEGIVLNSLVHTETNINKKFKLLLNVEPTVDLRLMKTLPVDLKEYRNCYLLVNDRQLHYIQSNGARVDVAIRNFSKFVTDIRGINSENATKLELIPEEMASLITSNGGQVPSQMVSSAKKQYLRATTTAYDIASKLQFHTKEFKTEQDFIQARYAKRHKVSVGPAVAPNKVSVGPAVAPNKVSDGPAVAPNKVSDVSAVLNKASDGSKSPSSQNSNSSTENSSLTPPPSSQPAEQVLRSATIAICYGATTKEKLTKQAFRVVVERLRKAGIEDITVFFGQHDNISIDQKEVKPQGEKELNDWKRDNASTLRWYKIKEYTHEQMEKTSSYRHAAHEINKLLINSPEFCDAIVEDCVEYLTRKFNQEPRPRRQEQNAHPTPTAVVPVPSVTLHAQEKMVTDGSSPVDALKVLKPAPQKVEAVKQVADASTSPAVIVLPDAPASDLVAEEKEEDKFNEALFRHMRLAKPEEVKKIATGAALYRAELEKLRQEQLRAAASLSVSAQVAATSSGLFAPERQQTTSPLMVKVNGRDQALTSAPTPVPGRVG